jgi:hypothetical protein
MEDVMSTVIQSETFYDAQEMVEKLRDLPIEDAVLIFDAQGEPIQSFTLQEVVLTDGSKVFNLVMTA